jgi:uncharacterized cupin superfamily protein
MIKMKAKIRKPTEDEKKEAKTWPIWEKEESEFPWEYYDQETCLILEGKAIVKTPQEIVEFGAGDYVVFPEGLKCTWEIKKKIRKHYKFG